MFFVCANFRIPWILAQSSVGSTNCEITSVDRVCSSPGICADCLARRHNAMHLFIQLDDYRVYIPEFLTCEQKRRRRKNLLIPCSNQAFTYIIISQSRKVWINYLSIAFTHTHKPRAETIPKCKPPFGQLYYVHSDRIAQRAQTSAQLGKATINILGVLSKLSTASVACVLHNIAPTSRRKQMHTRGGAFWIRPVVTCWLDLDLGMDAGQQRQTVSKASTEMDSKGGEKPTFESFVKC